MAEVFGYELVAQALKNEGADTMFFIMGGPMLGAQDTCRKLGMRMIDVRHEQAAAMMANAYARLTGKAGLCSTASGPAATNLLTGLAHALTDAAPIIALGGASPIHHFHTEAFQEVDQLNMMRPASKWAGQAINAKRLPEYINIAYRSSCLAAVFCGRTPRQNLNSWSMRPVYPSLPRRRDGVWCQRTIHAAS